MNNMALNLHANKTTETATMHHPSGATTPEILFLGKPDSVLLAEVLSLSTHNSLNYDVRTSNDIDKAITWLENRSKLALDLPKVILCDLELLEQNQFKLLGKISAQTSLANIPFIVLSNGKVINDHAQALRLGIDDCYTYPFNHEHIRDRIIFLQNFKKVRSSTIVQPEKLFSNKPLFWKRAFDIALSLTAITLLMPIMLLIALAIKLESKGPIIYRSQRVGTGYRIFDFLKFRSMSIGADAEIEKLQHLNQYTDDDMPSFFKVSNDPRITRIGRFIRNTSLDELPQLFNILKGDMSIVGNRPLPLYEAEQLTRDVWAKRFLAPAGLTGLWQVSKRGNTEMSAIERMELDNTYADKCSFIFDMKIILKTIPAMFQHESV